MKPWHIVLGVGVLLAALAVMWTIQHNGTAEVLRKAEAEILRLKNIVVAEQKSKTEIAADAALLVAGNDLLRQELARAMAASPGSKPVATGHVTTGIVNAGSTPPVPGSQPPAISTPGPLPPGEGVLGSTCLLAPGGAAKIDVDTIVLETKLGNYTLSGTARLWTYPKGVEGEPLLALAAPFQASGTHASVAQPSAQPRWGVGMTGVATPKSGALLGPVLALPPLHLFGSLQLEVSGGPLVGLTTPDLGATATILARF